MSHPGPSPAPSPWAAPGLAHPESRPGLVLAAPAVARAMRSR
jgi:hypothetical protein